jgi:hypothetical protein
VEQIIGVIHKCADCYSFATPILGLRATLRICTDSGKEEPFVCHSNPLVDRSIHTGPAKRGGAKSIILFRVRGKTVWIRICE